LAALLLLLVVALANGAKYFSAGKSLYVGERLVQESKYTEALPHLQKTLNVAPNSDKAALLAAKAAILSGHPEIAQKALQGHAKGYFDDASNPQFQEVNGLWNRTNKAMDEIDKAQKLEEQDGQEMQAAQLMHAAAADYPQMPNIALAVDYYDSGAAFARKDYDQFLAIGEKDWKLQPSWSTALSLVSSLDCKYAATGDEQYRTRSEEMFIKSRELGKDDKEAERVISEFSDRHKYRIQTRKIISKQEFDRQFRNNGKGEKKN
jgi:tetratricopeptide (TPR) repeat protein